MEKLINLFLSSWLYIILCTIIAVFIAARFPKYDFGYFFMKITNMIKGLFID